MDITTIILNAAKVAKVSGTLLLAICTHESGGFKNNYAPMDHGSPSYGSCQIKKNTAEFLGFKGHPEELNDPKVNSRYAALYLKYQESRYGDNWVKLTASYNSGSYAPSKKQLGCPKNLKYVNLVKMKLPEELQSRLDCAEEIAENQ